MLNSVKTTVALTAGGLALGLLGAAPQATAADQIRTPAVGATAPQASGATAYTKYGRVTASTGVKIRSRATTYSRVLGSFHSGAKIALACKTYGQNVDGNHIWYKLGHRSGWVTARYVKNLDYIPWCR
ncbi:SH3 domain-containing protein [Streptomyces sp. NPDC055287]